MAAHRKYKWEEWFGKPRTILVRGIDYQCSQASMTVNIRNNASQRGVYVHVIDVGIGIVIEVRGHKNAIPHTDQATITCQPQSPSLAQVIQDN